MFWLAFIFVFICFSSYYTLQDVQSVSSLLPSTVFTRQQFEQCHVDCTPRIPRLRFHSYPYRHIRVPHYSFFCRFLRGAGSSVHRLAPTDDRRLCKLKSGAWFTVINILPSIVRVIIEQTSKQMSTNTFVDIITLNKCLRDFFQQQLFRKDNESRAFQKSKDSKKSGYITTPGSPRKSRKN